MNRITCDNCDAVIECKKEELKFVSDWRDGNFYWFKCPECKSKKAVAAELIK